MCTVTVILFSAVRLAVWRPIILAAALVMCKFGPVFFFETDCMLKKQVEKYSRMDWMILWYNSRYKTL